MLFILSEWQSQLQSTTTHTIRKSSWLEQPDRDSSESDTHPLHTVAYSVIIST